MGQEYEKTSFRQRIKAWNHQVVGDGNPLPYVVYVVVSLKMTLFLCVYQYFLRDPNQSIFSELNMKRYILYNIIGDVLGTNSTGGPMGFRMKIPFCTWFNMLTPGSITCPLLPGVKAVRTIYHVAGYVLYLLLLIRALIAPTIGAWELVPIVLTLAPLTAFDFVIFQASRGEHFGYMLICLCFPWNQAVWGCQMVQVALWTWAGIAKIGPWMKYVNAFMMPNCQFLRLAPGILPKLYKNKPKDVNPSLMLEHLATFGVTLECTLGVLCIYLPTIGVFFATCFHVYILSMVPFASVMEWNLSCLYLVQFLFNQNTVVYPAGGVNPLLLAFLAFVLVAVPFYGQLFPKEVPFLTAFRPYAGNWRFSWHIVDKKAKEKLRKLKTLESVFIEENAQLLWNNSMLGPGQQNPHFCKQFDHYFTGNMVFFPHFRPLVPIMEQLEQMHGWGPDDYVHLFNEIFLNAVMGWTLGTGWYLRKPYFEAVTETCDFKPKECYVAIFEPHGLNNHMSEWHVIDITNPDVKVIHGKMHYSQLEKMQPTDMTVEQLKAHSILEKKLS